MSGAGGEVVGKALVAVAQVKIGRIVLWILSSLLVLMAVALQEAQKGLRSVPMALAFILALLAVIGAIKARRERSPSPIRWLLPRVALAVVALGAVAILLWLRRRRGAADALPPPPLPEEVDQLARVELEQERAA
jgi:hypothetical protein